MKEENEMKQFLLPYKSILKVTKTNEIRDTEEFKVDTRKSPTFSWGIHEYHCDGNTRVVDSLYQYATKSGIPTGEIKSNLSSDSDYIPDQINSNFCTL